MKRTLSILLLLTLVLPSAAFVSCGETATQTETVTQTVTKSETESITEPETESITESVTESSTESETEPETETHNFGAWSAVRADGSSVRVCLDPGCGVTETLGKEDNIARIYDATEADLTEFIGYGCPGAEYEDRYEEFFNLLMQYGVTGILCGEQFSGIFDLGEFLEAAKKTGIDVYGDCIGLPGKTVAQKFLLYEGLTDCIKGLYLRDEPTTDLYPTLADTVAGLKLRFPDKYFCTAPNLFPSVIDPYPAYDEPYYSWEGAASAVFDVIGADAVGFDYYPFNANRTFSDNVPQLVKNLMQAKYAADSHGKTYWTFLQTTANIGGGKYCPNREQLLLSTHLSLACGADKLFLFTSFESSDASYTFPGLINKNFEVQEVADYVKNAAEHVNAMKGIYRSFHIDGLLTVNEPKYMQKVMETSAHEYLSITGGYETLLSVTTEDTGFIGCGKDTDGNTGFYLVNTQYKDPDKTATYTLTFDGETEYRIWGAGGLEDIGVADAVTVTVAAADAKFIVLVNHTQEE